MHFFQFFLPIKTATKLTVVIS